MTSEKTSEAQSATTTSTSQPDKPYKPVVGDVVEFEYKGKACQGLIFQHYKNPAIVSNFDHKDYYTFSHSRSFDTAMETARKIGETSLVKARHAHDEVIRIAKAYFSAPKFKVGDVVKVVSSGFISCGHDIGAVGEIVGFGDSGSPNVKVNGMSLYHSPESLELVTAPHFTGSYAERQAQWVKHYKIEAGSKVKVVRKPKDSEDGWHGTWFSISDDVLIGNVYPVGYISPTRGLSMHGGGNATDVPYFCLEPVQ